MSSNNITIFNDLCASLFLFCGIVSCLILTFVLIIHMKYRRLRKNIYSIMFASIICEILFSFHFIWTGINSLVIGENDPMVCGINALLIDCVLHVLFSYNILTILTLFLNKFPNKQKISRLSYNHKKQKVFKFIHIFSICFGILHSFLFYLSDNYGEGNFGSCFIKIDPNPYISFLAIPFLLYLFLSFIYLYKDCKKNYAAKFPYLKIFPLYCILTTVSWAVDFSGVIFNDYTDTFNSFEFATNIFALVAITYCRISNKYIQTILKQGDSDSNVFVQAIMIFFCLDTKLDVDEIERRDTMRKFKYLDNNKL